MSANITKWDVIVALEKCWHGLEKIVKKITFENSGLNFIVNEMPVFFDMDKPPIEGYKALVRDTDSHPISIMKQSYAVIQNSQIWECLKDALEGVDYQVVSTGTLGGLTKMLICVKLLEHQEYVVNGDKFKNYVTFCSSHDGSMNLEAMDASIRSICENTLNWSRQNKGILNLRVRHTKNYQPRIDNMKETIKTLFVKREEFYLTYKKLMETPMNLDTANKVLAGFYGEGEEMSTRSKNQIEAILGLYKNGKGNNGKTAADLLNGVTEYYTHHVTDDKARLYASNHQGSFSQSKLDFFTAISDPNQVKHLALLGKQSLAYA